MTSIPKCYINKTDYSPLSPVAGGQPLAEIAGPFLAETVSSDCVSGSLFREPLLWVLAYTLMGLCALVLLVLLLLLALPCRRRRHDEITDESSLVRHRIK